MGYHIRFSGDVTVEPPLSANDREILEYVFNPIETKQDVFFETPALPEALTPLLSQKSSFEAEFWVNAEGTAIEASGSESCYDAESMEKLWKQIVQGVLPSYSLNGCFEWDASDSNDGTGILWICGKQVEAVANEVSNPGPSWERDE